MSQLTPKEFVEIAEPVEQIYQRCVDELLVNISRHFNIGGWERTRFWEIKKLSELGALTQESVNIIAKNTKMLPEEIEKAFLEVAQRACKDIDPQLAEAAVKGILQDPATSPVTSPSVRRAVQGFIDQSIDKMNLTNTTMLESTKAAYVRAVNTTVSEAQLIEAKKILETHSLAAVTSQETRTAAIRKAMRELSANGITGFYDRAGRAWSPDAYAAMVVRTTSHNVAIESIKARQHEYGGGDIFQVSSHPGARPLCYPYQGLFFSWSEEGTFVDGDGVEHYYDYIGNSSYGEAAGLFGINCGHSPIPIVPGFSIPDDTQIQDKAENDKEYEESQIQRQYERDIREAKRDLEVAQSTGDKTAEKEARQKVKNEQARMRSFIDETGRARRYDRERIA